MTATESLTVPPGPPVAAGLPGTSPAAGPAARRRLATVGDLAYLAYPLLPDRWLYALARLRGRVRCVLRRDERARVRRNIASVFGAELGEAGVDAMTLRYFTNQQLQNLLVMLSTRMTDAALARLLPVEGLERLEAARAGRGAIFLGSHLNSVSLFVAVVALRRRGLPIRVAMPIQTDPWARTRLQMLADDAARRPSLREQLGAFYAQFNARPIVEKLAANEIVAMTGDGWHSAGFTEVEFLGRRLPFTTGAIGLARLTGAAVVPVFAPGEPPLGLRCVIEEPFTVARTAAAKRDVQEAVQRYARLVERHLRASVAAWQHWDVPDVIATMASWRDRPLAERYAVRGAAR